MAITLVKVNPKISVANLYVLLNDNFNIIEESLTDITDIMNIGTGKFDNTTFGTDNNIKTENIESIGTTGITITLGNLNVSVGRIIMSGAASRLEIGSNVKFERIVKNLSVGTVGPVALPRLDNATIVDITTPTEGSIIWDDTTKKLKLYDGTTWVDLN